MNNKGFTLVELLAVIILLALLFGVAIPFISSTIRENEDNYYVQLDKMVEASAENYLSENYQLFPKVDNSSVNFPLDDFRVYFSKEPKSTDGDDCTGYVKVTRLGRNEYKYESCLMCGDYQSPTC